MLELISKIFSTILLTIAEFYIVKRYLEIDDKLLKVKNLLLLVIVTSVVLTFKLEYQLETTLINFLIMIIVFKLIFNKSLPKTIVAVGFFLVEMLFADIINTTILMSFFTLEQLRGLWYVILLSNIDVIVLILLINRIKPLSNTVKKIVLDTREKGLGSFILFCVLTVIIIVVLFHNVTKMFGWNSDYIINFAIMITFFCLVVLFIIEKSNYEKLQGKYDYLFDYVQSFEDKIEEDQLNRHEYKNQLAVLQNLVKNKEAKRIISEMINISSKVDSECFEKLRYLPKGGIKGLIYYKMIVSYNKNVNLAIDISKDVTKSLSKLNETQRKVLTKLIGIFFDNAIEAAEKTRKKLVNIEIYKIDNRLNFVFTNNYAKKDIKSIRNQHRGYSTKGEGRGNGIYFATKIIKKNPWVSGERIIMENFYIQKIIVNNKVK